MPKFSIFHDNVLISSVIPYWWNICRWFLAIFNLLGVPDGQGLPHQNNSVSVNQVHNTDTYCILKLSKTGMLLSKLYWHVFLLSIVANLIHLVYQTGQNKLQQQLQQEVFYKLKVTVIATLTQQCQYQQILTVTQTQKSFENHRQMCSQSTRAHMKTHHLDPPHCESPHSAVAFSAAGPGGCGNLSLGQCAGWTGPFGTVTGCRSGSHWNTGRKWTDPGWCANGNYHDQNHIHHIFCQSQTTMVCILIYFNAFL